MCLFCLSDSSTVVHAGASIVSVPLSPDLNALYQSLWKKRGTREAEIFRKHSVGVPVLLNEDEEETAQFEVLELDNSLGVFPGGRTTMLVRAEYRAALDEITKNSAQYPFSGKVVSGQPGIGNTFFLFFLLVERLLDGSPTVFQPNHDELWIFTDKGANRRLAKEVTRVDFSGFRANSWALVDSTAENWHPHPKLTSATSPFYVVQASCLEIFRYKGWAKERCAETFVMAPWTWAETCYVGTYLNQPPLSIDLLRSSLIKFGPSARTCFNAAKSQEASDRYEAEVIAAIPRLGNLKDIALQLRCGGAPDPSWNDDWSKFFVIAPSKHRLFAAAPVSEYVMGLLQRNITKDRTMEYSDLLMMYESGQ